MTFSQATKEAYYTLTIIKGKVIKENEQTIWVIPTTLTNNTKDTLRYFSMSCSWQELYSVDNNKLRVEIADCDKNIPTILILAPGQSRTLETRVLISQILDTSVTKFKIGFNLMKVWGTQKASFSDFKEELKKGKVIWSNIISM